MLNRSTDILLMMLIVLAVLTGCKENDDAADNKTAEVSLAFNISTTQSATRMSDAITQQTGATYRDIQNLYLFPFNIQGTIDEDRKPLSARIEDVGRYGTTYYYLDDHIATIPNNTASFLCYAKAVPAYGKTEPTPEDKFVNGYLVESIITGDDDKTTSDISFAPEVIYNQVEAPDGASTIAAYLTEIAQALKDKQFRQFISDGHLVAASGTNAAKLAAWATNQGVSGITNTYDATYPTDINLPEGAAAVKWNFTENKFEPQPMTTTEANINSLNRFVYPAELWYYANSRIKTSFASLKNYYDELPNWADVLANYDTGYGVMAPGVHSVAINDPLVYAVGCLQIGLVVGTSMSDANDQVITLGNNSFPLTAVLVSGQHEQAFNFTPKNDNKEYIIYDKEIKGMSLGAAKTATPSTATPTKYTNTLVLQTLDGKSVRFALEFYNDSGQDFVGVNGTVFNGTKFYLVGIIDLPATSDKDHELRVFTKDYYTKGTVTISSLKQAYTYLPDMLDPRLEIAVRLIPKWTLSTPTNVPL